MPIYKSGKVLLKILSITLVVLIAADLYADAAKDDLMRAIGPRAAGMGGAFSAVADDFSAFYWNPAGLVLVSRQSANIFYDSVFKNTQTDLGFNYTYPMSDLGTAAATYRKTLFFQSKETDDLLYLSCATYIDENKSIAMGINIKMLGIGINDSSVSGGMSSVDIGLLAFPDIWEKKARFSFFIQDIDSYINWSNNLQEKVPVLFKLGTSYYLDRSLLVAGDFDVTHYGENTGYDKRAINLGMEKWFLNEIMGNFGFRWGYYWMENGSQPFKFTFGFSYEKEDFNIDYAYVPDFEEMGETHKLAVSYFIGPKQKAKPGIREEIKTDELKVFMEKIKDVEFNIAQKYFSPKEGSTRDKAEFNISNIPAGMKELQWETEILDSASHKVIDFSGAGTPPGKLFWDGYDNNRHIVSDGDYTAKFTVSYSGKILLQKLRIVSVNTVAPTAQLMIYPQVFAPATKSIADKLQINIDSQDKDIQSWDISITDKNNNIIKKFSGEGAAGKVTWDGKIAAGSIIKNGHYRAMLSIEDYAGNKFDTKSEFDVDTTIVTFAGTAENRLFKIGKESLSIGVNFKGINKVLKWDLRIFDLDDNLISKIDAKTVTAQSITWNGKDMHNNAYTREGSIYKYRINVTQKNGIILQKDGYCETMLPEFNAVGMKLMLAAVLFPKQDKNIPLDDYASLNQAADAIKKYAKNYYVFIRGYANDYDDPEKNIMLSIDRVLAVRDYFVTGQKIPEKNIYVMGAGDGEYIDTTSKEEAKAKGARVEVELLTK